LDRAYHLNSGQNGRIDIYDFDLQPWGNRIFSAEAATRAANVIGTIFGGQPYDVFLSSTAQGNKLMPKIALIFVFVLVIVTVLFLSNFFEDTKVQGQDFYDIFAIKSINTNGYWAFVIDLSSVKKGKLDNVKWASCKKLNRNVESFLSNYIFDWNKENSPLYYINEKETYSYKAYIKTPSRIIFLRGFSDFGGATPTEEEKNICEVLS
jgi:hypothetical protein